MQNRELLKFVAETLRNVGVGFVISSVVLFISSNVNGIYSILLFLLGSYNILFGVYIFWLYVNGGKEYWKF